MSFSKKITQPNGDDRVTVFGSMNGQLQTDCDDKDGRTALKIAAIFGDESQVQQFLERRAFMNSMDESQNLHKVMTAMEYQKDLMSVLPPDGDGRVKMLSLVNGRTPLTCAAEMGHTGVVRLLLQYNEDINERDEDGGMTALHRTMEDPCQVETIKLLLQSGADVEVADAHGRTPLFLAALEGQAVAVDLLLKYNANVNAVNEKRNHPLLAAARNGHVDVMELLLNHGADIDAQDPDGMTALTDAIIQGNVQMAQLLLDHHATVNVSGP